MRQLGLFGDDAEEPEEGKSEARKRKGLTARDRMLLAWLRHHAPAVSTAPPLGFSAKDLRRLEFEGVLTSEGAQVKIYTLAKGI